MRKINDGDMVRVFNDRGSIKLTSRLDFSLKKGCVWITNGWQIKDGFSINILSLGRETDMGLWGCFS